MKLKRIILLLVVTFFIQNFLHAQQTIQYLQTNSSKDSLAEFEEIDGLIVIEVESVNPGTGWRAETLKSGYTGTCYFRRTGNDSFSNPGNGLTEYKIQINTPGVYHFRWHSKIMHGADATESNDSWLRIPDAADFFAKNGNSIKYPNGGMFIQSDVVTNGSSADGWMKTYSSGTTSWTWSCRTSDNDPHEIYATFDTAGVYTVQISGRSKNHALDRFVMFIDSMYTVGDATDLSLPETMITDFIDLRSTLAVNYGTGSGSFQVSSTIEIKADNAPNNKIFDRWIGDTDNVEDIYEATTSIFLTKDDAVLTATYIDEPTSNLEALESKVQIYPNPTKGSFYIDVPSMENPVIKIYNLAGKVVLKQNAVAGTYCVNNHDLSAGTYIVQVSGGTESYSDLLVIH